MADKKKSVGPITFIRQVQAEGSKVHWTSQAETIQASIMVTIMSVIVSLFLFSADSIISMAIGFVTSIGT